MGLIDDLLENITPFDCPVRRVCIGLHWTVIESRHTGIAHTYKTGRSAEIESAGDLVGSSALDLARRLGSWETVEASLGLAALNSLIEPRGRPGKAADYFLERLTGQTVTVVGRSSLRKDITERANHAYFLEIDPGPGELHATACEEVIPRSDVVLITATALINKTLPRLLELSRRAMTIVLGPSTPLSDILFGYGVDVLAGVRVLDAGELISNVAQGAKKASKLAGTEPILRLAAVP